MSFEVLYDLDFSLMLDMLSLLASFLVATWTVVDKFYTFKPLFLSSLAIASFSVNA